MRKRKLLRSFLNFPANWQTCDLWATHKNQRLIANLHKYNLILRITMCMRVIIQSISHWLSWIQFSMTFFCLSNSLAVSRKFVIVYLPLWFTLDDMKKRFQSVEIAEVSEEEGVLVNIELLIILGIDCVQNITDFFTLFLFSNVLLFR